MANYFPAQNSRNHESATNYKYHINKYIQNELLFKSLVGPLSDRPMKKVHMNPLMSRQKRTSTHRRIIMDLTFALNNASVTNGIPKNFLDSDSIKTVLPTAQDLTHQLVNTGRGCYIYGLELGRAYGQLRTDPANWPLMALHWEGNWYLDKFPTFGIRLGAHFCCRATEAFVYLSRKEGRPIFAYIDGILG